jgi:hypothetical protein
MYAMASVTATDFRKDLFRLLDKAEAGEPVLVRRGATTFTLRVSQPSAAPHPDEASWPINPVSDRLRRYFEMVPETDGPGLSVEDFRIDDLATLNEDYEP